MAAIESHLGRSLRHGATQELAITAEVTGSATGFAAKLRFDGPKGVEERLLEHPQCDKLTDAAALVIALTIDPAAVGAQGVETAAPAAAPTPAPLPEARPAPPTADIPVTKPSPPQREATLAVAWLGFGSAGLLPHWGAGWGAQLIFLAAPVQIAAFGRYWLPASKTVPISLRSEIAVSSIAGGIAACVAPSWGAWSVRGCGGGGGADVWGVGYGVEREAAQHALIPVASAVTALSYRRDRFSPFVTAEALLPFSRPRFGIKYNGEDLEVFRPALLVVNVGIGLEYWL